ncbi:MAG: hypothetical protein HQL28_04770 [Candidatus Omnitrophica bacterium]|nr:hypothetical protein [Candidatus Omnitrophota bacterium]
MDFDDKYFTKFRYGKEQSVRAFSGALRDLKIAKEDEFPEVKFNYAYNALLKCGIALILFHGRKVKSIPGHHSKVIEKMSEILNDDDIKEIGGIMRSKRNLDMYDGAVVITNRECAEFIALAEKALNKTKKLLDE